MGFNSAFKGLGLTIYGEIIEHETCFGFLSNFPLKNFPFSE